MTAHVGVLGPFLALPQGSSPRRRRGYLEKVFDAFISTGSMDPTLRPMVAESWRLSLASGVSPDRDQRAGHDSTGAIPPDRTGQFPHAPDQPRIAGYRE